MTKRKAAGTDKKTRRAGVAEKEKAGLERVMYDLEKGRRNGRWGARNPSVSKRGKKNP